MIKDYVAGIGHHILADATTPPRSWAPPGGRAAGSLFPKKRLNWEIKLWPPASSRREESQIIINI